MNPEQIARETERERCALELEEAGLGHAAGVIRNKVVLEDLKKQNQDLKHKMDLMKDSYNRMLEDLKHCQKAHGTLARGIKAFLGLKTWPWDVMTGEFAPAAVALLMSWRGKKE